MRKFLFLSAVAAAAAVPTAAQAQRAPAAVVIVVDSDRIYRECNACRTAQQQLQTQVTTLRNRQQTLTNQLRPEGEAIQTAIQALNGRQPDAALTTRIRTFQERQEQAQQELARAEQNIQSIRANVIRQIDERMRPVINQVMTQRGANVAVDVNATLAHSQAVNATDAVLAGLNAALPAVSVTPLPQQQQTQQQPQPPGR
jgi:Skp family chaperone for outer membrane proteins